MIHFSLPKASLAVEKANVTHGILSIIDDSVTDHKINTRDMLNTIMAHCEKMKQSDF
mgnify:CR=1 FL=1